MKRLLAFLLSSLISIAALGASSQPPVPYPIPGSLGGTGGTVYVNPVMNSTAAAALNSSLIQTALNSSGHVIIDCNGPFYIGSTLFIKSNTRLTVTPTNCAPTGVAGTTTLLQNWASSNTNVPWTISQLNSAGTAGPFSVIWSGSTPAWVASTAYAQSATANSYTISNGNIYWLASASCTSGSTAPSGTGAGISDGGCSWNYVTVDKSFYTSTYNSNMTATVYWPSHGLSVNSAIAVQPVPDSPSTSGYWSGTQAAGTDGAFVDSAYFGTFQVVAVNDANWVTVTLRRVPQTGFSGAPMWLKVADQNITLDGGGTWNYNYPTNSGTFTGSANTSSMGIVFGWVKNLVVDRTNGEAVQKYALDLQGISGASIRNFNTPNGTSSDRIKVYGPAFDVSIDGSVGSGGDDVVSLQTEDLSGFIEYSLGAGDILGVTVSHVTDETGLTIAIYPTHQFLFMDDLSISDVQIRDSITANYRGAVSLYGGATITTGMPTIGNIRILRSSMISSGSNTALVRTYNGGSSSSAFTVNNLLIDGGVSALNQSGAIASGAIFSTESNGSSATSAGVVIKNMKVENTRSRVAATNQIAPILLGSGTFGNVVAENNYADATTAGNGYFLYQSTTTDHIAISNNYVVNLNSLIRLFTASVVDLVGNHAISSSSMAGAVINVTGSTINLSRNWFNNASLGLVRLNGSYSTLVHSTGDNTLTNGSVMYVVASGTPTTTMIGATDIAGASVPTVSSCGSGATLGANSNAINGTIAIPASVTSCTYTIPANSFSIAPRNCQASGTSSSAGSVACAVSWTNASTSSFTVSGSSIGGQTVNYTINP